VEYLKKETGFNIKQIFPDTFDEHMRMVGQGKVDISFTNPYVYVKTAYRYGEKAFAQVIEDSGLKSFRGQIICRADNSSIQTIQDCKGKRLIAVDLTSAGGYLYPMGHFYDHGIRQEDFAEVDFSHGPGGKQEKVILAVYVGQYDIGLIREGALNVVADRIDIGQIRVVAHSKYYPGWVYSARKDLEPEVLQRIQKALFKLSWDDPDHRKILEKADFIRVVPSHDAEFELIRELLTVVGIDLDT
jgi:phosphonate transport system substrate-binding protein